jgi:hypothetical protein
VADTSLVQSLKVDIIAVTHLSKDALHVYLGLIVWLLAAALWRKSIATLRPWLVVFLVALGVECFDVLDAWRSFGQWRVRASVHDVINTMFWPTVLALLARHTRLLK